MAQKLKLHSPVGAEALIIKWPVATSEGKEGPEEIVDTIRLVCEDFPELTTPLATRILKQGEDVSSYDYEQTKSLCDRYNKAIDSLRQLVKGSPRSKQFSKRASRSQLKHILQQCYNQSVKDPEKLNQYQPFSPGVYGETSFELVEQMIKYVKFSESDYFIDLGSGVGQVVLQVSAATDCKFCYGIEKAEWPAEYAVAMEKEFVKWMKWYGKEHGKFLLEKGDFLHDEVKEKLSKATIVFVNNFAFGPKVDHELKQRFANCLKEGARIVSSKEFCPLNFRITERNLSDIGTIMQVEELSPLCGAVSWTGKPFAYYVHTIDRTLLEKYFQRLKNPNKKDEVEPRKDRKGRPVMSIKDKINGALSGTGDSNSAIHSRWRRSRNQDSHSDTASPLLSTAAKMLDFDSCSNSSQVSNSCSSAGAAGGTGGQDNDQAVVYGPTTRRQWNEYVKRPQSHSQSGTENDDSSNGDVTQDQKDQDAAKAIKQRKKKMKTVKRLNNGVLGKRQLQQKQGRKPKTKEPESPPANSKTAVKLRPRQKQPTSTSPTEARLVKGSSGLAAPAVTINNQYKPSHNITSALSQPPSLDSLNLLHAHTIMSTSGKESVDSVHYNDRRMTETSSAYFKPTVQTQTVSMLEKQAGFLDMIENMKQRFLSFLTFMQSPQYRAMLLLQIEQEKAKNVELKAKTESLEKDISVLQKDGLGLIKERLKEMGIKADTPRELLSQAKDIVLSHKELQAQTASLGAQINALQAEHDQKVSMHKKALDRKMAPKVLKNGVAGNIQYTTATMGSSMASQRYRDQQKRLLMANVDRLHAELQQLQDVNKRYTRPCSLSSTEENGRLRLPSNVSGQQRGILSSGKTTSISSDSFILKEKMDMKENYDTFGEVLSTLKQEMDTTLSPNPQSMLQVKAEPKTEKYVKPPPPPPTSSSSSSLSLSSSSTVLSSTYSKSVAGRAPVRQQITAMTGKEQKDTSNKTLSASGSDGLSGQTKSERLVFLESSNSTPLTAVSSSWTTQSKVDGVTARSSPRILPAGMKIDIKKPCKIGVNSIKSPPVNVTRGKILSAKTSSLTGFKHIHGSSNGIIHHNTSTQSGETYTDNEKSAAEDLISLKEGLSCNNPVPLLLQQKHQSQLQQLQHQNVAKNSSFLVSSTSITNSPSLSLLQSPVAGSRVVTLSKQQNHKTSNQILPKVKPSQLLSSSKNRHANSSSRSQPIIISEPSSIVYAHTLIPSSLTAAHQQQNLEALNNSAVVDLGTHQYACSKTGPIIPNTMKIVSSLQHHPNTVISTSAASNNIKHKVLDSPVSGGLGPSSPKFRTLEPKNEGKKLSSLLAAPSLNSSSFHSHSISNDGNKPRSTVRHLLTAPSISALSIGSPHSASITTIANTTPLSTDLIPYVAIQTPQNSSATTQGTNGAQPALLKLLQQQNHHQHVVVASKATSNVISRSTLGTNANTNSSIQGSSRSTLLSALPTSVTNQTALDHKEQAVKLIPSNGLDGKGCVQCSDFDDQSVVTLSSLGNKDIVAAAKKVVSPYKSCGSSLSHITDSKASVETNRKEPLNHSDLSSDLIDDDNEDECSDKFARGDACNFGTSPVKGLDKENSQGGLDSSLASGCLEDNPNDLPAKKIRKLVDLKSESFRWEKGNKKETRTGKSKSNRQQSVRSDTSLENPIANSNGEKIQTLKKEHIITCKSPQNEEKGAGSWSYEEAGDKNAEEVKNLTLNTGYDCSDEIKLIEEEAYPQHEIAMAINAFEKSKGKEIQQAESFMDSKIKRKFNVRESNSSRYDNKKSKMLPDAKKSNSSCKQDSTKALNSGKSVKPEPKEDIAKSKLKEMGHDVFHHKDKSHTSQSISCKGKKRSFTSTFCQMDDASHKCKSKSSSTKEKEEKGNSSLSPFVKVENMQKLELERSSIRSVTQDTHKTKERRERSHKDKETAKGQTPASSRGSSRSRMRHTSPGPPQLERAVSPPRSRAKVKKESSDGFLELFSVKEELLVVSEAKDSSKKTIKMYGRNSGEKKNTEGPHINQDMLKIIPCEEKESRYSRRDYKEKLGKSQGSGCLIYKQSSSVRSGEKRTSMSMKQSHRDKNLVQENIARDRNAKSMNIVSNGSTHLKLKHGTRLEKSDFSSKGTEKDADTSSRYAKNKSQISSKSISCEKEKNSKAQMKISSKIKKEHTAEIEPKSLTVFNEKLHSIKDKQEDYEEDLDANVDSPDAMLTPVSLSQFNQEDEEGGVSQSSDQCILQNSKEVITTLQSSPVSLVTKCDVLDRANQPNSNCLGKKPETSCTLDLESFPFPPTPQKTPMPTSPSSCAVSTTSSPCSAIPASPSTSVVILKSCVADHSPDSSGDAESYQHMDAVIEGMPGFDMPEKSKPDTTTAEGCPQSDNVMEENGDLMPREKVVKNDLSDDPPSGSCTQVKSLSNSMCSSPLFPQKTMVLGKRACGRSSSTSSKCSSDDDDDDDDDDSSSTTTNSSSSTGSSSDDDHSFRGTSKKRKRKSKKILSNTRSKSSFRKTPPKKLSLLHPPLSLSIGSPSKAPVQYSPMPSPSVNGFSSYASQMRLGLGGAPVPSVLAGKSSSLTPLSISVQHSPGYQMVSADSMRSPNGVMRSPVGSGNSVSGSVVLKQYSTFPGPSSLSPTVGSSSLVPAPKLSPQLCFKKEHVLEKTPEVKEKLTGKKTNSPVSFQNQSMYASNSLATEFEPLISDEKPAVKDYNANNTEEPNFYTINRKDVIPHTLDAKGGLKIRDKNCDLSASKSSNKSWQENSFPNSSMPCLDTKQINQRRFVSYIPSKPQHNLNKNTHSQGSRPVEPPPLPVRNHENKISQSFEKPSCVFANVSESVAGKDASHRHARQIESHSQFELPEQQPLLQNHHKSSFHQPRPVRAMRSGGCGGQPPSSQQISGHWGQQQQHTVGLPVAMFRGRHSRFGGLVKPRVQSSLGYFNPGEHSRQHYNHYRGPPYPPSTVSGSLAPAHSSSPPPLLSPMDQPYGSDWWILVMQNNQAGSTSSAQLGGTMLNGQPQ